MRKLTDENLVRRVEDSEGRLLGWSPARKSSGIASAQRRRVRIERGKGPRYYCSRHHDREVGWILEQVKKLPNSERIESESKIRQLVFKYNRTTSRRELRRLFAHIPDGRFTLRANGITYGAALELELTQKTHARIPDKLILYIAKTDYDLVLYEVTFEREMAKKTIESSKRRQIKESTNRYPFILSGKVFCEKCGQAMVGRSATGSSGKVPYYEHGS